MVDIYEKFKYYNQEKLFEIGFNEQDYNPEIIAIVKQIIAERGLTKVFEKEKEEYRRKRKEKVQQYKNESTEEIEYLKKAFEIKNEGNFFHVRISDIQNLESALLEHDIEFHSEDSPIGLQLKAYPTQTYFFRNKDIQKVDEITKALKINTDPYADNRTFVNFEVVFYVIIIIASIVLLLGGLKF